LLLLACACEGETSVDPVKLFITGCCYSRVRARVRPVNSAVDRTNISVASRACVRGETKIEKILSVLPCCFSCVRARVRPPSTASNYASTILSAKCRVIASSASESSL